MLSNITTYVSLFPGSSLKIRQAKLWKKVPIYCSNVNNNRRLAKKVRSGQVSNLIV